jgi:hypothetical protein
MSQMFILTRQSHHEEDGICKYNWTITISPIVDLKPSKGLILVPASNITEQTCEMLRGIHHDDMSAALSVIVDIINSTHEFIPCDQIYRQIKDMHTEYSERIVHFFNSFQTQFETFLEAIQQIIVSLLGHRSEAAATK